MYIKQNAQCQLRVEAYCQILGKKSTILPRSCSGLRFLHYYRNTVPLFPLSACCYRIARMLAKRGCKIFQVILSLDVSTPLHTQLRISLHSLDVAHGYIVSMLAIQKCKVFEALSWLDVSKSVTHMQLNIPLYLLAVLNCICLHCKHFGKTTV